MSADSHDDAYGPAPGALELARNFVNTADLEAGTEILATPDALAEWLEENGFDCDEALGPDDLERALAFREHLRALLLANNGCPLEGSAVDAIASAGDSASMRFRLDEAGKVVLEPQAKGVGALIGTVLAGVLMGQGDGTWARLKACPADGCAWAFYDKSRNGSRTWCLMAVCGNRAKTRRYREVRVSSRR